MGYAGSKYNRKVVAIRNLIINDILEEARIKEKLRKLDARKQASPQELREKDDMLALAAKFVEEGIAFEDASEKLQNHHFFKVGYNVALRKQSALAYQESNLKGKIK